MSGAERECENVPAPTLQAQEETGQRQWEAELHRLQGIALFGLNRLEEGQSALGEALRIRPEAAGQGL